MPYTLAKALVWLVLAGVLGLIVGWLLRSVTAKRQLSRARSQHADGDEVRRLRARVAELEAAVAAHDGAGEGIAATAEPASTEPDTVRTAPSESEADQIDAATEALGRPVARDDLKVIEGIGLSIEDLCHGIGIRTWADMAATEPSLLRTMLNDAGPRFKMLDPDMWPRQAALLAAGDWEGFRDLVDELRNGVGST